MGAHNPTPLLRVHTNRMYNAALAKIRHKHYIFLSGGGAYPQEIQFFGGGCFFWRPEGMFLSIFWPFRGLLRMGIAHNQHVSDTMAYGHWVATGAAQR